MRRLVFVLLLLCLGSHAQATPNYQCIADCTAQNNKMSYCQSRCAYQNPSVIPKSQPMFKPLIPTQRGMKYECLAQCQAQGVDDGYCRTVCAK